MTNEQRKNLLNTVAEPESMVSSFWLEVEGKPYYRCRHRYTIIDELTGEVSRIDFDDDRFTVIGKRPLEERFIKQLDSRLIVETKLLLKKLWQQLRCIEKGTGQ